MTCRTGTVPFHGTIVLMMCRTLRPNLWEKGGETVPIFASATR